MQAGNRFSRTFDPRANGLNFVRLLLAGGVIVWHSFPLTGHTITWWPLRQIMAEVWVDAFFAVSGFLIVRSWMQDPNTVRFVRARLVRILPAFWTCLLVTALIIAPLATSALGSDNFAYILKNAALWVVQFDIAGTPTEVPYEGVWNGSIWTLAWEFACYCLVLAIGALGLLKRRVTLVMLFALCFAVSVAASAGVLTNWFVETGARFGMMFLAGALVWQYRDNLRVSRSWILAALLVLTGSLWLPDYRVLAAIPLAYIVLVAGAVLKTRRLRFRNDISYGVYIYAFPVQQTLAILGMWEAGVVLFALAGTLATIPLAAASWFLIEKPAMRLKARHPSPAPSAPQTAAVVADPLLAQGPVS